VPSSRPGRSRNSIDAAAEHLGDLIADNERVAAAAQAAFLAGQAALNR